MLKLAWKIKNEDYEILAYDLIGKDLAIIGNLQLASKFHLRFLNNIKEPVDSPLRMVGILFYFYVYFF